MRQQRPTSQNAFPLHSSERLTSFRRRQPWFFAFKEAMTYLVRFVKTLLSAACEDALSEVESLTQGTSAVKASDNSFASHSAR
jgi:hypothetical protein